MPRDLPRRSCYPTEKDAVFGEMGGVATGAKTDRARVIRLTGQAPALTGTRHPSPPSSMQSTQHHPDVVPASSAGDARLGKLPPATASLSAAPLLALVEEMCAHLRVLAEHDNEAGSTKTLRLTVSKLQRALIRANVRKTLVRLKDVRATCDVPMSTLTYWCREHGDGTWASQPTEGGSWVVDLDLFHEWLRNRQPAPAGPTQAKAA